MEGEQYQYLCFRLLVFDLCVLLGEASEAGSEVIALRLQGPVLPQKTLPLPRHPVQLQLGLKVGLLRLGQ